jgi:hypothetical protein
MRIRVVHITENPTYNPLPIRSVGSQELTTQKLEGFYAFQQKSDKTLEV